MRASLLSLFLIAGPACYSVWADDYNGPRPPKPDVPYLQHADNLVETEVAEAKEVERKNETAYILAGDSSPVRTPLAEPVFLFTSENIPPGKLGLFRLEIKSGSREVAFPNKRKKNAPQPLRLMINRLDENLYRIEANEYLDNGEYCLTPDGTNQVFCFQVY